MTQEYQIEYIEPEKLAPHPLNPKRNSRRQRIAVAASLREFGFVAPAIAQKTDDGKFLLLDGHLRRELFKDGRMPVVVVDWPEEKQKRFLAAFDRTGNLVQEDDVILGKLLSSMEEKGDLPGFSDKEVQDLLGLVEAQPKTAEGEEEEEAASDTVVSQDGDVWCCGRKHRIMCGDPTERQSILRVMDGAKAAILMAEPLSLGEKWLRGLWLDVVTPDWGGYVFFDDLSALRELLVKLADAGVPDGQLLVWRLGHAPPSLHRYKENFRFILFVGQAAAEQKGGRWYGGDKSSATWKHNMNTRAERRPLSIYEQMIRDLSIEGEAVACPWITDSGALIAAERLGRVFYGISSDPKTVDTVARRWRIASGRDAVLEGTKLGFSEVERQRASVSSRANE